MSRNCSRSYFFTIDSPTVVRDCHSFFRKKLNISDGPIIKTSDINECGSYGGRDMRGKQMSVNKTPESSVEIVKEHIKKFPVVESHYCRQSSKRLYLNTNFSVAKMQDMYVDSRVQPVYVITYRRIFSINCNYSFFRPKINQCLTYTKFKRAEGNEREQLKYDYEAHIERKNNATKSKKAD
ncbi:hypothetical protein PR048_022094 [Dryococelus australis]|uniref:Uncharacterized protein n=1 Tax=Dryococelus australis TaxID=614101 RepID=A0ABQ9H026_9NEOP|nr:hypothetical protein PR048_022094 [Dryococelus australis]